MIRRRRGGLRDCLGRVKNVSFLRNRLDTGSKKRLDEYMKITGKSYGLENPIFDGKVKEVLLRYALRKNEVLDEINYLDHLRDEEGFLFSRNLKLYPSIDGAMTRFSDPDYTSFRWNINYQKALKQLIEEVSNLHLRPLSYCSDDDIREVLPKLSTHSGFTYILTGVKKKGENIEGLKQRVDGKIAEILDTGTLDVPILIGFRTQGSGEYDDDGVRTNKCKHKTRVISMIDLVWVAMEFMYMKPFQEYINKRPYYAGGKDDREILTILRGWWTQTKYRRWLSIDYSNYDQSISGWLMEDAYSVIEAAFDLTDEERKVWKALVHDAIHKKFVLAEGVLESHKGVPSGLPSTQIIDTLVNGLITLTYFNSIKKDFEMMAMGDDNIIFVTDEMSMDDLGSYIRKNFGMEVHTDDKSSWGDKPSDPKFLSRTWKRDGVWRHPYQLLSRLLFPERFRPYDKDNVSPEEVVYAMVLTYRLGMRELIDVSKFLNDNRKLNSETVLSKVGSRYLPGALSYKLEYTMYDASDLSIAA